MAEGEGSSGAMKVCHLHVSESLLNNFLRTKIKQEQTQFHHLNLQLETGAMDDIKNPNRQKCNVCF